jgi:NAD(P)-dependent dehydrogenase (short-subunit alcohol dehydrogenase family)
MATFTSTYHHTCYPAIDPASPLNSQAGHTVLITGATRGIGLASARAYITAGAARVIVLSRQELSLGSTIENLKKTKPAGSTTEILGRQVSIDSAESISKLWDGFEKAGIEVDVLVLNAAKAENYAPILANGSSFTWSFFETNVLSSLRMTEHFMQQGPSEGKVRMPCLQISFNGPQN